MQPDDLLFFLDINILELNYHLFESPSGPGKDVRSLPPLIVAVVIFSFSVLANSPRLVCSLNFLVILFTSKYIAAFLYDSLCLSSISVLVFACVMLLPGQNTPLFDFGAFRVTCADSANRFVHVVGAGLATGASLLSPGSILASL